MAEPPPEDVSPDAAGVTPSGTTMRFQFETLMSVSFAKLEPPRHASGSEAGAPPKLVLRSPVWAEQSPLAFPPRFLHVAAVLLLGTRDAGSLCALLPWDVWTLNVLPHVTYDAFEACAGWPSAADAAEEAKAAEDMAEGMAEEEQEADRAEEQEGVLTPQLA